MTTGWFGAYLRVDLTTGRAESVPIPRRVLCDLVGGVGLGTWICLVEGGADIADALDPDAPLVIALSPLVGTPLTTSAKLAMVARSPLTGMLSDGLSSSHFALAARSTGCDAICIVGCASSWSELVIDGDDVTLCDATDKLGLPAAACTRPGFRTAAIGVAGENRVRFATISNDGRHAGRGGLGAVMGSKQLKAISVRGDQHVPVADARGLAARARDLVERSRGPATARYRELGTISNLTVFNRLGILPTENFRKTEFSGAAQISDEVLREKASPTRSSCAACTIGCEHRFKTGGQSVRLEYESLFALGSLLGVSDHDAVLRAAARCDELGLDTVSAGGTLALAMEVGYAGLSFGQAAGAFEMLGRIARREGDGDLLADGSLRAARKLGCEERAMQVKGLEVPGYHPRGLQATAVGFAISTRGADHNRSGAYELDFSEDANRLAIEVDDMIKLVQIEDRTAILDSLILCKFLRHAFDDLPREASEILELVTGERIDLLEVGARVCTLRKIFNIWAGWQPQDDDLPGRLLGDGLTRDRLQTLIACYNTTRGWTPEGWVPRTLVEKLGLHEILSDRHLPYDREAFAIRTLERRP